MFSRFWIIFTIIFGILYQVDSLSLPLLFGLVGIYLVPLPTGYFSVSSSCLCCLRVGWPFRLLEVCEILFIVEFPHCGWGLMAQGFLVWEAYVGVLVGGAGFLLSEVQ